MQLDSLKRALKESEKIEEQVELLYHIATHYKPTDTLLYLDYIREIRAWSLKENYAAGLATYYHGMGELQMYYGKYKSAEKYFTQSLDHYLLAQDRAGYAHTIADIGNTHLFRADYDIALEKYNNAKVLFEKLDHREGVARCLNNMGIIYKNHGKYDQAIECYTGNVQIYEELNDQYSLAQTFTNLGNVYVFLGSYALAQDYFERAYTAAASAGRKKEMSLSLLNSGVIQNKIGHHSEALGYYQRSLELGRELNDKLQISNCLTNIGTNYIPMQEYDLALKYIEEGLEFKKEMGDVRLISNSYNFLAEVYYHKEDFDHAIALDLKAINMKRKIGDVEGLSRCYNSLARSYVSEKAYSIALAHVDTALRYSEEIGALEQVVDGYRLKKDIQAAMGNYEEAFNSSALYNRFNDSLHNEKSTRAVNEIEMRYRARMLKTENERLTLQSRVDRDKLQRQRFFIVSGIVFTVFLASILILVSYYRRKDRILNQVLRKKNELITNQNKKLDQLNQLKNKILTIINHDLRGKIGNQVVALNLLVNDEFINEAEKKVLFGKLGNSATVSIELLENLVLWSKLQEDNLEFRPEERSIRELAEEVIEFFRQRLLKKRITIENNIEKDLICAIDRTMFLAVLRNLVSNAIKYSGNDSLIQLFSEKNSKGWGISVKDFGTGMAQKMVDDLNSGILPALTRGVDDEKGSGIGLSLVREFVRLHHGNLLIKSTDGAGTEVIIRIECIENSAINAG